MRYLQKAVCFCTACKKDIVLLESVAYPGFRHQETDPVREGWRRFCFEKRDIFICPKHEIGLVVFVDGIRLSL